tara:strand:+ start:569 stop:1273 length:705 start_codon:yes stop_codon:yes gene_type:complete
MDNCWASFRGGCDTVSREHYFSEGLLPEIVTVSGPSWTNGETLKLSRKSLTAKCLCRKHNSELSILDKEAIAFHNAMDLIKRALDDPKSSRSGYHIVDGTMLLRWCCKTIAGIHAMENQVAPDFIVRSAFDNNSAAALGFSPIVSENTSLQHLDGHIGFCQYIHEHDSSVVFYSIVIANMAFFVFPSIQHHAEGVFHNIIHSGRLMDRMKKVTVSTRFLKSNKHHKSRVLHFLW